MSKRKIYSYSVFIIIVFFMWIFSNSDTKNEDFSETVKLSLRDVGNQLLLISKDSTSLILPIVEVSERSYKVSFQNTFILEPSTLVSLVKNSFQKSSLPKYYRVEVIQCIDNEVAYSYEIKNEAENDIVPCKGRVLPESCYAIEVKFTNKAAIFYNKQLLLYLFIFLVIIFLSDFFFNKNKQMIAPEKNTIPYEVIGSFQFYPEQNKLVKKDKEIRLSKKECELLAIFVANPNQIIKRDQLTKKVWEDNGVFVGRSLDTYISKLRKILKEDATIKLTNVHGVGYKLEIEG